MRKAMLAVGVLSGIGIAAYGAWNWYEFQKLAPQREEARVKLAFVSIRDRLPRGKAVSPGRALSDDANVFWGQLDQQLAEAQQSRVSLLKAYHEKTQAFFVKSPDNGSGRRFYPTPDEFLTFSYWQWKLVDQMGEAADFPVSAGEKMISVKPNEDFLSGHKSSLQMFLRPAGFGYIKDLDHVSGFASHGFRGYGEVSFPKEDLRVDHIHLVGILQHERPVVYMTDKMPSMEQVKHGKARPLDTFEETALHALQNGEDLYIVRKDDTLRMLGALRATTTCQKCHDAQVGDLLGAFSYTLRPEPKVPEEEKPNENAAPQPALRPGSASPRRG